MKKKCLWLIKGDVDSEILHGLSSCLTDTQIVASRFSFKTFKDIFLNRYHMVVFENFYTVFAFYFLKSHPSVHLIYDHCEKELSFSEKCKRFFECFFFFKTTGRNSITFPKGFVFEGKGNERPKDVAHPLQLFFLGTPSESSSRDGLKWFLREVWPFLNSSKFELNLMGESLNSWGEHHTNAPGLKFIGQKRAEDFSFGNFDFGIHPIRIGFSHQSLIIQSIAQKLPIISSKTTMKNLGLDKSDYFLAESPYDWIRLLDNLNIIIAEEKSQSAFLKMKENYSHENIAKKTFALLEQISP